MAKKIDLTGCCFGRLTVVCEAGRKNNRVTWLCNCSCGNDIVVVGTYLRNGDTKSCGCLKEESIRQIAKKHGYTIGKKPRLYTIWENIRRRCNSESHEDYRYYGGRGIHICPEWNDFERFYEWAMSNGYRDDLTIDRIDGNAGYSPDNCRWVTLAEQQSNKSNNRLVTYCGETKILAEWARTKEIPYGVLQARLDKLGWSVEKALSEPVNSK